MDVRALKLTALRRNIGVVFQEALLFDRFRQLDSFSTRAHEGSGLGLFIAKGIVEAHGGTIRAESEGAGKGSTFTITLPATEMP